MDKYAEAKALFQNAEISYVGHSNGPAFWRERLMITRAVNSSTSFLLAALSGLTTIGHNSFIAIPSGSKRCLTMSLAGTGSLLSSQRPWNYWVSRISGVPAMTDSVPSSRMVRNARLVH